MHRLDGATSTLVDMVSGAFWSLYSALARDVRAVSAKPPSVALAGPLLTLLDSFVLNFGPDIGRVDLDALLTSLQTIIRNTAAPDPKPMTTKVMLQVDPPLNATLVRNAATATATIVRSLGTAHCFADVDSLLVCLAGQVSLVGAAHALCPAHAGSQHSDGQADRRCS